MKPKDLVEQKLKEFDERYSIEWLGHVDVDKNKKDHAPKEMMNFIRSLRSQAHEEGKREAIEEVERLTIYTFNPVGGISNIKYIRLSDIDVLKRKEKV